MHKNPFSFVKKFKYFKIISNYRKNKYAKKKNISKQKKIILINYKGFKNQDFTLNYKTASGKIHA